MKVIKSVTDIGTVNHRDAYFKASMCEGDTRVKKAIVFAVALRNPVDKTVNLERVKQVLDGRIKKRFEVGSRGKRIEKFTKIVALFSSSGYLYTKGAMAEMLTQFKRVCERELADELGLKWNAKEGDIIKELSVESGDEIKTESSAITKSGDIKIDIETKPTINV